MQKLAIAVLAVLVLFLLAANVRLQDRRTALERKLSGLESRPSVSRPVRCEQEPVPEPPVAPPTPVAVAAPPPARAEAAAPVLDATKNFLARALTDAQAVVGHVRFWTTAAPSDDDLGLTKDQKAALEELRRVRDLQTKGHQDQIKAIEEQTEAAIRQVLTPDQLAKYDAQNQAQVDTFEVEAVPTNRGYLGVSGVDADGGGARLSQVFDKSAAAETGLKADDVILEFNGDKVANYGDLAKKIQANPVGTAVMLRVRRGDAEFFQAVTLGARK
jgi:PDZ domain-containing protein